MKLCDLPLDQIAPACGDRFSPNLHRFLTGLRQRNIVRFGAIYRDEADTLWLGYLDDGFLIGAHLMAVLCHGRKTETFAYGNPGALTEVADFWQRYLVEGRCAIDPEHTMSFIDEKTRWAESGDHRSCLWCGKKHQRRERWIEPVQRERWVMENRA